MSKCLIAMASSIHLYIKSPSSKAHLIIGTSSFKEFLVGSRKGLKIKMSKIVGVHLKAKIENFNNAFVAKNTCTVLRNENKPLVRLLNSKYLRIGFFFLQVPAKSMGGAWLIKSCRRSFMLKKWAKRLDVVSQWTKHAQ